MSLKERLGLTKAYQPYWDLTRLLILAIVGIIACIRIYTHWSPSAHSSVLINIILASILFCTFWQVYRALKPSWILYILFCFIFATGMAMNLSVLVVNSGYMPVHDLAQSVGRHIPDVNAHFLCLSDCIYIGETTTVSLGDMLIGIGLACLLFLVLVQLAVLGRKLRQMQY